MRPKIILTRPLAQSHRFAEDLQAASAGPLDIAILPLMEIVPLTPDAPLPPVDHVIFTSANAVAQVDRLGLRPSVQAWCVGDQTAAVARAAGFQAQSAKGNSADLVAEVIKRRPPGRFLHLRGAHTTGNVAERLTAAGLPCAECIVYDQRPCVPPACLRQTLAGSSPVIVPLFSPRSSRLFGAAGPVRAPLTIVAISAATADAFPHQSNSDVIIAPFPDKSGMIAAILGKLGVDSSGNTP